MENLNDKYYILTEDLELPKMGSGAMLRAGICYRGRGSSLITTGIISLSLPAAVCE